MDTSENSPTQKEFLALAIPNMLAAMAVPITHLVDLAYLGHLEDVTPLSGVVLGGIIFSYIYWCFSFLRVGTTGLTAQAFAKDDKAEQQALFWRPILLGLAIGCTLTLLQKPIENLSFALLSGEVEVETAGKDYYRAMIWGAIPIMISLPIIGWLLGKGHATMVWGLHTVWQVSNIILNYFFIVEFGWGAYGAGLGTTLAEWIAMFAGIGAIFYCWKGIPTFNSAEVLNWAKMLPLLTLNSAIMLRTFLLMSVLAAFTNISATYGEVKLAANALLQQLFMFFAYVCDGYAIALEILAGKAFGKNNITELRRSFRVTLQWTMGSALLFFITYGLFATDLLSLLTEHKTVLHESSQYVWWLCSLLFIGGLAFIYDGLFYGLAKPKVLFLSMVISVTAFIPPAYYAWQQQSSHWLWAAFLIFTVTRAIVLTVPTLRALQKS